MEPAANSLKDPRVLPGSPDNIRIAYSTAYTNLISIYDPLRKDRYTLFQGPQIAKGNTGKIIN